MYSTVQVNDCDIVLMCTVLYRSMIVILYYVYRILSQLREIVGSRKQQFFTVDPNDKDFIKMKENHEEQQQTK